MTDEQDPKAPGAGKATDEKPSDRRKLPRRKQFRPIRVRPSHPGDGDFDEVNGTIDAHREGFYFASDLKIYKKGMRLFVSVPYSPHAQGSEGEYLGEVVRVENRADGKVGVAVFLLHPMNLRKQ